jgi:glycosyltransferase involved in cell wall biosynthesis
MKPYFSIIIPAHNEERYISNTLKSIKKQIYQDYEIIVVANGCKDQTEKVVKKNINEKIRLFSLPKAHVSLARNHGAEKAQGDVLLFLDADTTLEKDSLKKIKKQFRNKHSVATTLSKPDKNKFGFLISQSFKNFYNYSGIYRGCSGALICRKHDFIKVKGYPLIKLAEHRKLTIKLKEFGKFSCVKTFVITSMRRYEEWGLTKLTFFHSYHWLKRKLGRKIEESNYEAIR